jgi:RHS repeat-associated protein
MLFFHADHLGSTKLITSPAGEAITGSNGAMQIVYNPYGDIDVDNSHGPDVLRNKFTGQELDNESGLYYYKARYYDPALGRFITPDSFSDASSPNGTNRYMYVNGNPVRFNDPSGHHGKPKWMVNATKSIVSAIAQDIMKNGSAETRVLATIYGYHYNKEIRKKERKANQELIVNVVISVVLIVVDCFSGFTLTELVGPAIDALLSVGSEMIDLTKSIEVTTDIGRLVETGGDTIANALEGTNIASPTLNPETARLVEAGGDTLNNARIAEGGDALVDARLPGTGNISTNSFKSAGNLIGDSYKLLDTKNEALFNLKPFQAMHIVFGLHDAAEGNWVGALNHLLGFIDEPYVNGTLRSTPTKIPTYIMGLDFVLKYDREHDKYHF